MRLKRIPNPGGRVGGALPPGFRMQRPHYPTSSHNATYFSPSHPPGELQGAPDAEIARRRLRSEVGDHGPMVRQALHVLVQITTTDGVLHAQRPFRPSRVLKWWCRLQPYAGTEVPGLESPSAGGSGRHWVVHRRGRQLEHQPRAEFTRASRDAATVMLGDGHGDRQASAAPPLSTTRSASQLAHSGRKARPMIGHLNAHERAF
jgi:hypothetical protein